MSIRREAEMQRIRAICKEARQHRNQSPHVKRQTWRLFEKRLFSVTGYTDWRKAQLALSEALDYHGCTIYGEDV